MTDEEEQVEDTKNRPCLAIFSTITGSRLYGFATEQSDKDFRGFCLPQINQLLGMDTFKQQDYNNNEQDGPTKSEGSIFSLARFIYLGIVKCNPTVLEIAFTEPQFHIVSTPLGLEVCKFVRENSITKRLFKPYNAYHRAQVRKLQSMERTGKRAEIVREFQYDVKFSTHAFRLGRQATVAMLTGKIVPTLTGEDLEISKNMRAGKYTKEEALKLLSDIDAQMYDAYKQSTLPAEPDYHKANEFLIDIHSRYIKGEYDVKLWSPW